MSSKDDYLKIALNSLLGMTRSIIVLHVRWGFSVMTRTKSMAALCLVYSFVYVQSLRAQSSDAVPGEFLVKFKNTLPAGAAQNKLQGKVNMKSTVSEMNLYHVSEKTGYQGQLDIDALRSDPDVEYVEPNFYLKKSQETEKAVEKF